MVFGKMFTKLVQGIPSWEMTKYYGRVCVFQLQCIKYRIQTSEAWFNFRCKFMPGIKQVEDSKSDKGDKSESEISKDLEKKSKLWLPKKPSQSKALEESDGKEKWKMPFSRDSKVKKVCQLFLPVFDGRIMSPFLYIAVNSYYRYIKEFGVQRGIIHLFNNRENNENVFYFFLPNVMNEYSYFEHFKAPRFPLIYTE